MTDSDSGLDRSRDRFLARLREHMYVYTPLFDLRHNYRFVPYLKLWRGITVGYLLGAAVSALLVWLLMRLR